MTCALIVAAFIVVAIALGELVTVVLRGIE